MRSEVQILPGPPVLWTGGVAQLGEHLLCKQGVVGSSPITSTSLGAGFQVISGLQVSLFDIVDWVLERSVRALADWLRRLEAPV